MRAIVVWLFVVGAAEASPLSVVVGGGVGQAHSDEQRFDDFRTTFTAQLDVGVRVHPVLSVGLHGAFGTGPMLYEVDDRSMFDLAWDVAYLPLQVGAMAHVAISDRYWVSPWLGTHVGWLRDECMSTLYDSPTMPDTKSCNLNSSWRFANRRNVAVGISGGADVFAHGDHRLTAYLAASFAENSGVFRDRYMSVMVGLAYRYWANPAVLGRQ